VFVKVKALAIVTEIKRRGFTLILQILSQVLDLFSWKTEKIKKASGGPPQKKAKVRISIFL